MSHSEKQKAIHLVMDRHMAERDRIRQGDTLLVVDCPSSLYRRVCDICIHGVQEASSLGGVSCGNMSAECLPPELDSIGVEAFFIKDTPSNRVMWTACRAGIAVDWATFTREDNK